MDNPITLQVLQEGCCKAFLEIVKDIEDVMQDYDIAIIDGKSQLTCDDEIPQRRRTFGFYWKKVYILLYNLTIIMERIPFNCTLSKMVIFISYHVIIISQLYDHIIVLFLETPRKFITAVINLRGVSTNKTIIYFIAMQTYKEPI